MITEAIGERLTKTIKYVSPVPYSAADGLTAEVYQQLQADFMPAPLVALHSPLPEVMAGVWSILRETLLAGAADRSHKEAVAAAVSKSNECPYCVEAHTVMLRANDDHNAADALVRGSYDDIHDPQLNALIQWVLASQNPQLNDVFPPFSSADAPEIIGTAVAFHYINRMVNVFLGETLLPVPSAMKGLTHRLYAATAGKRFARSLPPGHSLKFVPKAELPDDFFWAAKNPVVAGAFAGFARVLEEAAEQVLPEAVRSLVEAHIYAWDGQPMGISRRWLDTMTAEIEMEHRAAARLTLLTAFASYQVDASIIDDFRTQYPDDTQLIAATAWASFTAARRVRRWFAAPLEPSEMEVEGVEK